MQHKCSCLTKTQKITPKIDLNKRVKLNRSFFITIISLVTLHGRPFLKSSGTFGTGNLIFVHAASEVCAVLSIAFSS